MKDMGHEREGAGGKRPRKPPQPTGELRDSPCDRCMKTNKPCYSQAGGHACLLCASLKLKCEVRSEKGRKAQERSATATKHLATTAKPPARSRKGQSVKEPSAIEPKCSKPPVPSKKDEEIIVLSSDDEDSAPVPKHRPRSKIDLKRATMTEDMEIPST
jgi:hypothetical protein